MKFDSRVRNAGLTALACVPFLLPALFLPNDWALGWSALVAFFSLPAIWVAWSGVAWLPTPSADVARIVRLSGLRPGELFIDLGAGDARVLIAVHRETNAQCVGYEGSLFHYLAGRLRVWVTAAPVQLRFGNLHNARLSDARAAYVWGSEHLLKGPLFAQLATDFPKGLRLLSRHHPVPGLTPSECDGAGSSAIFVYEQR